MTRLVRVGGRCRGRVRVRGRVSVSGRVRAGGRVGVRLSYGWAWG